MTTETSNAPKLSNYNVCDLNIDPHVSFFPILSQDRARPIPLAQPEACPRCNERPVFTRSPHRSRNGYTVCMRGVIEKVQQGNNLLYLVGDYNISLLNVDSYNLTADFNDTIYSYGLVPLITRPTRMTETSATLIDNIFTNKSISYDESMYGILVSDISEHYTIFHNDKILKHKTINVSYLRWYYSEKNKRNKSVLVWQDVHSAANAQHAFSLFHKKLRDLHDSHFPEKSITKRYFTRKPWLVSCLWAAIRKKNKLWYIINKSELNACKQAKNAS